MARTRTPLPVPVKRVVQVLAVLFLLHYVVLPFALPKIREALPLLGRLHPGLVALAVALEAASILSYTNFMRAVIPHRGPRFFTVLRVQLATLAVSHVVPGGTAAGGALGYRLLTKAGMSGTDTAFTLATQGIGSAVVLNVLFWLALVVSIPLGGFNPVYGTAALLGVLLIAGFAAVVVLLMRGEQRAASVMRAVTRRVPFLDEERVYALVLRLANRVQALAADRSLLRRAVLWDLGFWLFTAAALWVWLGMLGEWMRIDSLLVAFCLTYVVAALPVTPAGLGVAEVVLASLLTAFGAPAGVAWLGVLGYRLVNFWLPIPLGALAYLSLEMELEGPSGRKEAAELRRLAEESIRVGEEDRHHWAERHGLRTRARPAPTPPVPAPPEEE